MLSPHSGGAVPLADSTGEGGVHLSGGFIRFLLVQKKFVLQMKGPCAQTMMEGEGTAKSKTETLFSPQQQQT